jgi:excisionase family DNA binding protein
MASDDPRPSDLVRVSRLAERLDVHPETVREWVRKRAIKHYRVAPGRSGVRLRERDIVRRVGTRRSPV